MSKEKLHDPPKLCPVTGEALIISELTAPESGISIRGRFKMPMTSRLDDEQQHFLEVFLRSRGVISTMEKELGISYPTVRGKVDQLLDSLGLEPYRNERKEKAAETKRKILKQLEEGKITPSEAKEKLKGVAS